MNKIEQTTKNVFDTNQILKKNFGLELLLIPKDKLKNELNNFKNAYDKKDEWKIYLGLSSTLSTLLVQ